MLTPDPPVRKDGLCACGCGKTRPIATKDVKLQRRLRLYAGDQAVSDPFATARCARRYHGCEIDGERGVDEKILEARSAAGAIGKVSFQRGRAAFDDPVLA